VGTPRRQRRSLTNVGGPVTTAGDAAAAVQLARALAVGPAGDSDADPSRAHVHGFHPYPARLHPVTAERLIEAFVPPAGCVLDPFCGSGTVLVEAMLHRRPAVGIDLNPLAVRLARCKTRVRSPDGLVRMIDRARAIAGRADARRKSRSDPSRRFPSADLRLFEPHVLFELDSLRTGVDAVRDDDIRDDLSLVLSAILVKLSRQRSDTSRTVVSRRTTPGFAARTFVAKAEDLANRLGELAARLPRPAPPVTVALDDAAALRTVHPARVAAVITSPPYAATYDYVEHHELRLRWLGLDAEPFARGELGARARYSAMPPADARRAWSQELSRVLKAAHRVLPAAAPLVLVMADSAVGAAALRADEIIAAIAGACGFDAVARASQTRPHFHGPTAAAFRHRPRAEHALLLRCVR